jgi:hypothetical protein
MQARCNMQDKSDSDAVLHGMKREANNSLLHQARDAQDQRAECPTEHGTTLLSPMFTVHGTISDFDGCGACRVAFLPQRADLMTEDVRPQL